jgi:hypothetical protein
MEAGRVLLGGLKAKAAQQPAGSVDPRQIIPTLPLGEHPRRVALQRVPIHKLDTQQRHGDAINHQRLRDVRRPAKVLRQIHPDLQQEARFPRATLWLGKLR